MEMPKAGEAHSKLEKLLGRWSGEETMYPSPWDPKGGSAVGRVENRLALDGFAVIQDYEQIRNSTVSFRGHGVFRWDAGQKCYVLHWFDSMGMPPNEFRGNFENDVLTVSSKDPQGHNRAVFDFREEGHYRFSMDVSQDGKQWHTFMTGKYRREG